MQEGYKEKRCEYCDKLQEGTGTTLPSFGGHDIKTTIIAEATCENTGSEVTKCVRNNCNYVEKTETIKSLGRT